MNASDVRAALAAAAATLLGSCALLPVFATGAWFPPVAATVAVVLAGGLLLRWAAPRAWASATAGRPVPGPLAGAGLALVPLAQLLLVGWLLTALYTPARLFGGLFPTWRGARAVASVLADGSAELREQATPALPLHGLVALTVLLVGLVAVAVDLVAVAARQAMLAGIGLLVLYCVPVSTITGGIGILPVAAPAAGLALLLWTDQRRRLGAGDGLAERRSGPGTGGLAAARIGLLALVAALVVGGAVPTFAEGSFASGVASGGGSGTGRSSVGTSLDPVASLKGQLTLPAPVDLLRVKASVSDPGYLRALALDTYTPGRGWTMGNLSDEQTVAGDTDLAPLPSRETSRTVRASITSLQHNDRYLPVLSSPATVTVRDAGAEDWRFDRASATVFGRNVTTQGRSYTVVAEEPQPSIPLLESSPALTAASPVLRRYTQLPELDPSIGQLVGSLTDAAATPYDKVVAIESYFTDSANGFSYSLSTAPGTSSDNLVNFLTNKRGYCEQFAGAMAVLVRAAGIPARVALGYTPGSRQTDGSRIVTSHDAHAWVEVYFSDLGWVPFDPTPIEQGRAVQLAWAPHATTPDAAQNPAAASASAAPAQSLRTAVIDKGTPYVALRTPTQQATWIRPVIIGGSVLAVAALLLALPPWIRGRQRRRRIAAGAAADLWDELGATARDLGLRWQPADTPRQTARRLGGIIRAAAPEMSEDGPRMRRPDHASAAVEAVRRLALAEEAASYARPGGTGAGEGAAGLRSALKTARRGLVRATPRVARARARLWPASLMSDLGPRMSVRLSRPASRAAVGRRTTRPV
ncbi:MAG: Transglutaminase-like enzyme predicted cysteine protease [Frankiales bacterium]|nr:Transglutaminase-like enzyme predicted cysteine protease [Frankiales bacterium]